VSRETIPHLHALQRQYARLVALSSTDQPLVLQFRLHAAQVARSRGDNCAVALRS
jgi:hypothetical protein